MITVILCAALTASLGLGIIAGIAWALLTHPLLPRIERITLGCLAGGILWGGFNRLTGHGLSLGDVLLLTGVALLLWRFFVRNPKIGVLS